MKCQAIIEDYRNGERYNLARVIVSPETRQCRFEAKSRLGKLCLCKTHVRLAYEGFVDVSGQVASKGDIAITRRRNESAPYNWADELEAQPLEKTP